MVQIRLTNTRTRRKEDFRPIDADNVRLYLCGPTVYDRAHLGNARPVVVFDVLVRLLRHVYGADHVTYVRNFTDVDDKINATALARQQAGAPGTLEDLIRERTHETIGCQPLQILARVFRRYHQRQYRSIGGYNQVVSQAALADLQHGFGRNVAKPFEIVV